MAPIIRTEKLRKVYAVGKERVVALNNVDLSIEKGEFCCIVGQSGSGIFVAPSVIAEEVCRQYGVTLIGQTEAVHESFYAISVERRLTHPCVVAITKSAQRFSKETPHSDGTAETF